LKENGRGKIMEKRVKYVNAKGAKIHKKSA
jgi:hypothetical protein